MTTYRINKTRVVYEVLNVEVIAIDFESGNYYALMHVAKNIWQMIEQLTPVGKMAKEIADLYDIQIEKAESDLREYVQQLFENGLIELSEHEGSNAAKISRHDMPYEAPKLQTYTDVQNLLLLDPIHEVTETGWPHQ